MTLTFTKEQKQTKRAIKEKCCYAAKQWENANKKGENQPIKNWKHLLMYRRMEMTV
jgi:hypothetical protein